jgi:hypothetical protein
LLQIDDFAKQLGPVGHDYLKTCRRARTKRQVIAGFMTALAVAASFGSYATYDTLAMQQAMRRKADILVRGGLSDGRSEICHRGCYRRLGC